MKNSSEHDISRNFFGGYNKADVKECLSSLSKMLEESQDDLEKVCQEKAQLQKKLEEAESCYRGLWERSRAQDELIQKQQEILIRLTEKKGTDKEPLVQQLSQKLDQLFMKYKKKWK